MAKAGAGWKGYPAGSGRLASATEEKLTLTAACVTPPEMEKLPKSSTSSSLPFPPALVLALALGAGTWAWGWALSLAPFLVPSSVPLVEFAPVPLPFPLAVLLSSAPAAAAGGLSSVVVGAGW